jgi:hypothetical protein
LAEWQAQLPATAWMTTCQLRRWNSSHDLAGHRVGGLSDIKSETRVREGMPDFQFKALSSHFP